MYGFVLSVLSGPLTRFVKKIKIVITSLNIGLMFKCTFDTQKMALC